MKWLLDQGLPRTDASLLRDAEIDAIHTAEIGFAFAADLAIIERARREDRVIVTLDSDFHALLALHGALSPSVVRIRIEGLRENDVSDLIQTTLADWHEELESGSVLTVQPGRIRFRYLPLLSVNR